MDAPKLILLVAPGAFPRVDAMVSGRGMDVITLEVAGLNGYGFWESNKVNEVVKFLLDNLIDFRLLNDSPSICLSFHSHLCKNLFAPTFLLSLSASAEEVKVVFVIVNFESPEVGFAHAL
ncbi:hypothetical protein DPMN_180734 [Dreissena polymorpha]|uniref:Uncharacterized protein n=1 Tax=Dreissena polymorpha TaxID=45954 RepID=A0A9D4DB01_DREPO|nr:hypothetical protein DPMN_180734 [Dreissena polymorpha]